MSQAVDKLAVEILLLANRIKAGQMTCGAEDSYLQIEADGTLRFNGSATVYRDELSDLIGKRLESPASDVILDVAEGSVIFKDSATLSDFVYMNTQINHDWKLGSIIYPHLHWWQTSANIPNWLIGYRWQRNGQAKTTTWTYSPYVSHAFDYVAGTLNQITMFETISPPSGYSLSDILQIKLFRDTADASTEFGGVADPLVGNVNAVSLDFHIEIDTIGSRSELEK